MPSTETDASLRERALTQQNVAIVTAILIAVPAAYAFHAWSGTEQGDFLLLLLLAVTVPTAYGDLWTPYDETWKTVAWTLGACAVAGVEFVGLYVTGADALSLSPFAASVSAFGAVTVVNIAWLLTRR